MGTIVLAWLSNTQRKLVLHLSSEFVISQGLCCTCMFFAQYGQTILVVFTVVVILFVVIYLIISSVGLVGLLIRPPLVACSPF